MKNLEKTQDVEKTVGKVVTRYLFTAIILFIILGSHLFTRNIHVDTHFFILNPTSKYNWLEIGRFGLIVLRNIVKLDYFTPYFASGLFFIFAIIANLLFQFSTKKYIKNVDILLMLSIFLIYANPIYTEQFYFHLQYAEIVLAIIFEIISVYLLFQYIDTNKIIYAIISIPLMVIAFGTYQSFVPIFICLVIGMYLLRDITVEEDNIKNEFKNFIKIVLKLFITFLISYVIYSLIANIFIDKSNSYMKDVVLWGKEKTSVIFKNLATNILSVINGETVFFDHSFIVMAVLLILSQIVVDFKRNIFTKFKNLVVVIVYLLTPFLIEIYLGANPVIPVRSQLTLPITVALGFIIIASRLYKIFKNEKICNICYGCLCIIALYFSLTQYHTTCRFYYANDLRNDTDTYLSNEVYKDICKKVDDISDYYVIIIGKIDMELPLSAEVGEFNGVSLFNAFSEVDPKFFWSTERITQMWMVQGKKAPKGPYKYEDEEISEYIDNMKSYPQEGYIQVIGDHIIVKMSDMVY